MIFFEGPDGCGKTELSLRMSQETGLKRFKVETERDNWAKNSFVNSLAFDAILPSFVRQLGLSFISDRGYASEWVYSQVFGRETDMALLEKIDSEWGEAGACHVILMRKDYTKSRPDDLIEQCRLDALHEKYREFADWSSTDVIGIFVDEFMKPDGSYDVEAQMKEIYSGLEAFKIKKRYPRVYEIIREGLV